MAPSTASARSPSAAADGILLIEQNHDRLRQRSAARSRRRLRGERVRDRTIALLTACFLRAGACDCGNTRHAPRPRMVVGPTCGSRLCSSHPAAAICPAGAAAKLTAPSAGVILATVVGGTPRQVMATMPQRGGIAIADIAAGGVFPIADDAAAARQEGNAERRASAHDKLFCSRWLEYPTNAWCLRAARRLMCRGLARQCSALLDGRCRRSMPAPASVRCGQPPPAWSHAARWARRRAVPAKPRS